MLRVFQRLPFIFFFCFSESVSKKLEGVLEQWAEFEEQLNHHGKWFRNTEALFRDEQLQATLEQKQEQLEKYKEKRNIITDKEKEIDEFIDKSHALLHISNVERMKPQISQISNK